MLYVPTHVSTALFPRLRLPTRDTTVGFSSALPLPLHLLLYSFTVARTAGTFPPSMFSSTVVIACAVLFVLSRVSKFHSDRKVGGYLRVWRQTQYNQCAIESTRDSGYAVYRPSDICDWSYNTKFCLQPRSVVAVVLEEPRSVRLSPYHAKTNVTERSIRTHRC